MISSQVVSGPTVGESSLVCGNTIQWTLVNDGTVAWPECTTLRLVGGPLLTIPHMEVPNIEPFQTVIIDLEVVHDTQTAAQIFYSLVTPTGEPFGEVMSASVVPHASLVVEKPVCIVAISPMDEQEGGLDALQGELKTVEWVVANTGKVPWPEDVTATLFYNTPGFAHLPGSIQIPALEPGMTAHVGITALMPEAQGNFKAMWAITSPMHPDFGDVLLVHFEVNEFPFMEWMLAEANEDALLEIASEDEKPTKKELSVDVLMYKHHVPSPGRWSCKEEQQDGLVSLGCVSGVQSGHPWAFDTVLINNGTAAWPADSALKCCFGSGFGCDTVQIGSKVEVGQEVSIHMELEAPSEACQTVWTMVSNDECFGPLFVLEAQ